MAKTTRRGKAPVTPQKPSRTPPPDETSRERFLRMAQGRMVNALHAVRLIGNLSAARYGYQDKDITAMYSTMLDAVNETFQKFEKAGRGPRIEDTFDITKLTEPAEPKK